LPYARIHSGREVVEPLAARVDRHQLAEPCAALDLGVERDSVGLAPEHPRAVAVPLPPADAPHDLA
jgi:hypothetical protein